MKTFAISGKERGRGVNLAFCESCGSQMGRDGVSCVRCGGSAGSMARRYSSYEADAPTRQSPLRSLLWVGVGSFAIVLLIVAAESADFGEHRSVQAAAVVDKAAMRDVMRRDNELGNAAKVSIDRVKVRAAKDLDRIATLMGDYVAAARLIDLQACPDDFAEAYDRHLSAWSDEADAVSSHPDAPLGNEAFAGGFFRGLGGDVTGASIRREDDFGNWLVQVKARDSEVQRTWEEVEALAVRYGAR